MRTSLAVSHRSLVFLLACALLMGACLDPTQVTFDIKTDIPCEKLTGTTLTIGLEGQTEKLDPLRVIHECSADGMLSAIGTYTVVPKGTASVIASIKVVAAFGSGVDVQTDCTVEKGYDNCVVARRRISFVPHHKLTVSIDLFQGCVGITCNEQSTCTRNGRCVNSRVDETQCMADSCDNNAAFAGYGNTDAGFIFDAGLRFEAGVDAGFDAGPGAPTSGFTEVAASRAHSCAITVDGGVRCWGIGNTLGIDASVPSLLPGDVTGLELGIIALSSGTDTCAIVAGGAVTCWGRFAPRQVPGLSSGVIALASGDIHHCALLTGGAVQCWGANIWGQLGDGSNNTSSVPVNVVGLGSGVRAIGAGASMSCAIMESSGALKCWGNGASGQLGNNLLVDSPVPVEVFGLDAGVAAFAGGWYHSCAVMEAGGVKCWGSNPRGQVGDGTTTTTVVPVDVVGLHSPAVAVSAGLSFSCALLRSGGVQCWGENNGGALGNGMAPGASLTAGDVLGLSSGATRLSGGLQHACVIMATGGVKCWGSNDFGELGNNATGTFIDHPVDVVQ